MNPDAKVFRFTRGRSFVFLTWNASIGSASGISDGENVCLDVNPIGDRRPRELLSAGSPKEHIFRYVTLHQHLRSTPYFMLPGRTGTPRPVVNSRGRRRQAGTKTLAQVLHHEENFIDFIVKCLHWDSERCLKPRNVLPQPFVMAGRRQPLPVAPVTARCPLASSSSPHVKASMLETSKTQIGAPMPLAARASGNQLAPGPSVPATPMTYASMCVLSSSMSQSAQGGVFSIFLAYSRCCELLMQLTAMIPS